MWQDNISPAPIERSWIDADVFCSRLTLGGYSDWRLPTRKELVGIVDYSKNSPSIDSEFLSPVLDNVIWFWSSTDAAYSTPGTWAWYVDFGIGRQNFISKITNKKVYARCVRKER